MPDDELAKEGLFVSADVFGTIMRSERGCSCRGPEVYEEHGGAAGVIYAP